MKRLLGHWCIGVCLFLLSFSGTAFGTAYDPSNGIDDLWENTYATGGPTYGTYRTQDISSDYDVVSDIVEHDIGSDTYCVGIVKYKTMAEGYGTMSYIPPNPDPDPREGWAYGYFATRKTAGITCANLETTTLSRPGLVFLHGNNGRGSLGL